MHKLHPKSVLIAAAASALLVACGGGGHDRDVAATTDPGTSAISEIPQSAQNSVSGLIAYVSQLIDSMTGSTGEPVVVGNAVLPTSDTTEAAP